jgi:hypothetical protein
MFSYRADLEDWSDLKILDDFYPDPDMVRREAFSTRYVQPNRDFPWYVSKTPSGRGEYVKAKIEALVGQPLSDGSPDGAGATVGRYSVTLAGASPLVAVHTDPFMVALVVYLGREPAPNSGTVFYRSRETSLLGRDASPDDADLGSEIPLGVDYDLARYAPERRCENVYNRAVLYNGRRYHSAAGYYGADLADGRLTQTFFFNVGSSRRAGTRRAASASVGRKNEV